MNWCYSLPVDDAEKCRQISDAFHKAMAVFDDNTIRVLEFHLRDRYNIYIGSVPCSSVEEIEAALCDIAGSAAELLISKMRSFLH
jgi:hypothetical protein